MHTAVKCYAISPDTVAKYSDIEGSQARKQFNKEYVNKYKTPDERLQDLKVMQARYLRLRDIVDKSHEFKKEIVNAENLFDALYDKINAINKFCLMVIQNPGLPESKLMNDAGIPAGYYWENVGARSYKGSDNSWLTYFSAVTEELTKAQEYVMTFMEAIAEAESDNFMKIARSNPNYITTLQSKIKSAKDSARSSISSVRQIFSYGKIQKEFITKLAEIKPEYAELFSTENLQF